MRVTKAGCKSGYNVPELFQPQTKTKRIEAVVQGLVPSDGGYVMQRDSLELVPSEHKEELKRIITESSISIMYIVAVLSLNLCHKSRREPVHTWTWLTEIW